MAVVLLAYSPSSRLLTPDSRLLAMPLVLFMRGVNVGKAKRFQPRLLADQLSHFGVSNVGAAGTFVVRGEVTEAALRAELLKRLPFACEMMVCQGRDLLKLVATEPFPDSEADPALRRFLSVLAKPPHKPIRLPWSYPTGEDWQVRLAGASGRFVLCHWRALSNSLLEPNTVIEKQFGVTATTRNWNTVLRICDLLK